MSELQTSPSSLSCARRLHTDAASSDDLLLRRRTRSLSYNINVTLLGSFEVCPLRGVTNSIRHRKSSLRILYSLDPLTPHASPLRGLLGWGFGSTAGGCCKAGLGGAGCGCCVVCFVALDLLFAVIVFAL